MRANDRFTCPPCNSDIILDKNKQLAGSDETTIGRMQAIMIAS
jgi:hypothetical protein